VQNPVIPEPAAPLTTVLSSALGNLRFFECFMNSSEPECYFEYGQRSHNLMSAPVSRIVLVTRSEKMEFLAH
jgi:hypothetical protein